MKKILLALTLVAFIFGGCEPTVNPVTATLSMASLTDGGLKTSEKTITLTVTNSSDKETTFNWERNETMAPTGWTYMVNSSAAANGTLTIAAGGTATIMFMIQPNSNAGHGMGNIMLYDPADKGASTSTFTYDYTAVEALFRINPVDNLNGSVAATDPEKSYHMWMANDNAFDIELTWLRTDQASNPPGWLVTVCTGGPTGVCWPEEVITKSLTIPANDSVDFKYGIDAQGTMGNGGSTCSFYSATDSATTVVEYVITHEVTF